MASVAVSYLMRTIVLSFYAVLIMGILSQLILNIRYKSEVTDSDTSKHYSHEEPINMVLIVIILIFSAIVTQIKCDYEIILDPKVLVVCVMAGIPIVMIFVFVLSQIIQAIRGVKKTRRWGLPSEKDQLTDAEKKRLDMQRKFFHILVFIIITVGLLVADNALQNLVAQHPGDSYYTEKLETFWGSTVPVEYLGNIFRLEAFATSRAVIVLASVGASVVLLSIEITRLSQKYHFPFHKTVQRNLRKSELDSFASYTHFIIGYSFAGFMLPSILWLATLSIIAFGDAAASTIGMKFGKHKIIHNGKSWEGVIAGVACTFLPVFLLVGPYYGIAAAITFALIDIYTPKPIKASDNILIPVIMTVVFIVIGFLGVPIINVLNIGFQ